MSDEALGRTSAEDRQAVAELKSVMENKSTEKKGKLEEFPSVSIEAGMQKDVLIQASDPSTGDSKYLVRGLCSARYHVHAANPTVVKLMAQGLEADIPGGGRIELDERSRYIKVYGYSVSYGQPQVCHLICITLYMYILLLTCL